MSLAGQMFFPKCGVHDATSKGLRRLLAFDTWTDIWEKRTSTSSHVCPS